MTIEGPTDAELRNEANWTDSLTQDPTRAAFEDGSTCTIECIKADLQRRIYNLSEAVKHTNKRDREIRLRANIEFGQDIIRRLAQIPIEWPKPDEAEDWTDQGTHSMPRRTQCHNEASTRESEADPDDPHFPSAPQEA